MKSDRMSMRFKPLTLAVMIAWVVPAFTSAQTVPQSPAQQRPSVPATPGPSTAQPSTSLATPQTSSSAAPTTQDRQESVRVDRIELADVTVMESELKAITQRYEQRQLSVLDLIDLQRELTHALVQAGYVSSGALISSQKVQGGVLKVQIVMGQVARIEVATGSRIRSSYLEQRLPVAQQALHLPTLQRQLDGLRRNPAIMKINTQVSPERVEQQAQAKNAILDIAVTDVPAWQTWASVANSQVASVGETRAEVGIAHQNVLGLTDRASVAVGGSKGATDVNLRYSVPVGVTAGLEDVMLGLYGQANRSRVVQAPLNVLEIKGRSDTFGAQLRRPVWRRDEVSVALLGAIEQRSSKNFILGEPFSSTINVPDGLLKARIVRVAAEGTQAGRNVATAVRLTLNVGSTNTSDPVGNVGPAPRFNSLLLQSQFALRLSAQDQLSVRLDAQGSDKALASLEKFYVGGSSTVRGYAENFAAGDQGWLASLEYKRSLYRGTVQLDGVAFIDAGAVRNTDATPYLKGTLTSAGVGLGLTFPQGVSVQMAWAQSLQKQIDRVPAGSGRLHAQLRWQQAW